MTCLLSHVHSIISFNLLVFNIHTIIKKFCYRYVIYFFFPHKSQDKGTCQQIFIQVYIEQLFSPFEYEV